MLAGLAYQDRYFVSWISLAQSHTITILGDKKMELVRGKLYGLLKNSFQNNTNLMQICSLQLGVMVQYTSLYPTSTMQ